MDIALTTIKEQTLDYGKLLTVDKETNERMFTHEPEGQEHLSIKAGDADNVSISYFIENEKERYDLVIDGSQKFTSLSRVFLNGQREYEVAYFHYFEQNEFAKVLSDKEDTDIVKDRAEQIMGLATALFRDTIPKQNKYKDYSEAYGKACEMGMDMIKSSPTHNDCLEY